MTGMLPISVVLLVIALCAGLLDHSVVSYAASGLAMLNELLAAWARRSSDAPV